jgi:hypothetical protein
MSTSKLYCVNSTTREAVQWATGGCAEDDLQLWLEYSGLTTTDYTITDPTRTARHEDGRVIWERK